VATVNETWLPLARLAARLGGTLDRGDTARAASLVDEARAAVDRGKTKVVAQDEAAHLAAASKQLDELAKLLVSVPDDASALQAKVLQIAAFSEARVAGLSARTEAAQKEAVRLSLLLVVLSVPLGAALLWLAGSALRPVRDLTDEVRRFQQGYSPRLVDSAGDDEIGALARALVDMALSIEERDRSVQAVSLQLRRVLDSLVVGVLVAEGNHVRLYNPSAAALWPVEIGGAVPNWLAGLPEGRHSLSGPDERQYEIVVSPFAGQGRILVGTDVTERNHDRERLQRSERLALVGQLLAQVTHEVRNPLNAMSLHAELLADDVTEEGKPLLSTIVAEIRRLEGVTERYLDLARRREPVRAVEDPEALVRSVVALEDERLRRLGVTLSLQIHNIQPVEIDGNVLRRTLLNLLRNAAEAGAKRVTVEVSVESRLLRIDVSDDGTGMDAEASRRVFEPFYSTKARGTGLGLAVSRQGIEDMGGSISVEGVESGGSRFTILLPVSPLGERTIGLPS
jgi:signal transduction histidine kinase